MFLSLFLFVYPFVLLLLSVVDCSSSGSINIKGPSSGHLDQKVISKNSSSSNNSELDLVNDLEAIAKDFKNVQSIAIHKDHKDQYFASSDTSFIISSSQFGPGEMGTPIFIENPNPEQTDLISQGYTNNGFNQFISDMISINRTLPDYRSAWCQKPNLHSRKLLASSIIITFHNEAWSTLMRTIHSILDRTPAELLSDIILVDDFSDQEQLQGSLEDYLKSIPKVKLIRLRRREGLIRGRIIGAANAKGPVFTFLDSHVEVTEGWLQPLVDRITRNRTTVISPVIDLIDPNTFEYRSSNKTSTLIGSFLWTLNFRWREAPDKLLKNLRSPDDPLPTPVIGAGMFSIHKDFFNFIGGFDENLEITGGENLEISFKTWMCGGRLEISPCSHIGHIYRKQAPYSANGKGNFFRRNLIRLAAVWLDEYAQYHFATTSNELGDFGDIENRIKLKSRINCKSFDWYMQNVANDLFNPKNAVGEGEIRNLAYGGYICLEAPVYAPPMQPVSVFSCHNLAGNQHWYYTSIGELRKDENCLDYSGSDVTVYPCHGLLGNQRWEYNIVNGFIIHKLSGKCLALEERNIVSMSECEDRITLRWQMEHYNYNVPNANKILAIDNKSFKNKK